MFHLINTIMTKFDFSDCTFHYDYSDVLTYTFLSGVASFEGFRPYVYTCPSGVRTIGFGHTSSKFTSKTNLNISLDTARRILISDLQSSYKSLLDTSIPVIQFPIGLQQALTDFVFNCGIGTFFKSSMYKVLLNWESTHDSDRWILIDRVCEHLLLYVYANHKKLSGLVRRRKWEVSLIRGC